MPFLGFNSTFLFFTKIFFLFCLSISPYLRFSYKFSFYLINIQLAWGKNKCSLHKILTEFFNWIGEHIDEIAGTFWAFLQHMKLLARLNTCSNKNKFYTNSASFNSDELNEGFDHYKWLMRWFWTINTLFTSEFTMPLLVWLYISVHCSFWLVQSM